MRCFAKNVDPEDGTAESVYDWEESCGVLHQITDKLQNPSRVYNHEW